MSQETTLTFEVLDFKVKLLVNKLYLKIADIYIDVKDKSPTVIIYNFPKNVNDYYVEKVELISEKKVRRHFRLRIYKNTHNLHNIFLDELNNFSFEIGFFSKNNEKLPKTLNIKIKDNKYNLKQICKTDLPFINSFGIINCDKTILINEKNEIYLDEEKKGSFNINFIASGENYILKILRLHKDIYPKLSKKNLTLKDNLALFIDEIKEKINEPNISRSDFCRYLTRSIETNKDYYVEDYKYFISNKIYPLNEDEYSLLLNYVIFLIIKKVNEHTESLPILKCFFNLLSKLEEKMKKEIINKRDILSFTYYFYEHYCSANKYKDCLDQKFYDFKIIYDTCSINWPDFDFVFFKECNQESAYYKALKLLEDILDNLKPNSKLLEILYLIYSGTGNSKNNNKTDKTNILLNLPMISKKNIITHIKSIFPNMIIRKNKARKKKISRYADIDIYSGIITFYEETLFNKKMDDAKKILIDEPDKNDQYTITIFICLLHELCSHLKLLIRDKTIKSPNIINDPYDNYQETELEIGESGRTMEYYINNDIKKIKFLKFSFSSKTDLCNHYLWTDENFESLNNIVEKLMDKCKSNEYLDYEMGHFIMKKVESNKEIEEEKSSEIDWDFSSPANSDYEEDLKNKSDFQNDKFQNSEKSETDSNEEDDKPIVKY